MDSMGKVSPGLLDGTLSELGDYRQCLSIGAADGIASPLKAQHCVSFIRPPLPPRNQSSRLYFADKVLHYKNTSLENTVSQLNQ